MKKAMMMVLVGALVCSAAQGVVLKFDFDDADDVMTAPGYTSVTRNSTYSTAVGYGFVVAGSDPLSDAHQSPWVVSDYLQYADVVQTNNWGDYFRVDVAPGQDYVVTFATGMPGWSCWTNPTINGVWYGWGGNPANADTAPAVPGYTKVIDLYNVDGGLNPPGQPRLRELVAANSGADPATTTAGEVRYGSYNSVRMYGWNNQNEYYGKGWYYDDEHRSEFLYIDAVTVTSDQLMYDASNDKYYIKVETYPGDSYGNGFAMLEIVPEPASLLMLLAGLGMFGLRRRS